MPRASMGDGWSLLDPQSLHGMTACAVTGDSLSTERGGWALLVGAEIRLLLSCGAVVAERVRSGDLGWRKAAAA